MANLGKGWYVLWTSHTERGCEKIARTYWRLERLNKRLARWSQIWAYVRFISGRKFGSKHIYSCPSVPSMLRIWSEVNYGCIIFTATGDTHGQTQSSKPDDARTSTKQDPLYSAQIGCWTQALPAVNLQAVGLKLGKSTEQIKATKPTRSRHQNVGKCWKHIPQTDPLK